MNTVKEFVINQANTLIKHDLKEFFTILHTNYYNTVDITFMDYFLELVNNEGKFCVEQEKLQEYGVLTNTETSGKIKRALDNLDLIEGDDYLLSNVGQSRLSNQHGGTNGNKKTYTLTPYAFKLCLIRAKNSKIYANYYLLLEKVLKHFQDYQYLYQQKLLSMKDDKIDMLINETKEQNKKLDKQSEKIDKQSEDLTNALNAIYKLGDDNEELKVKLDDTNTELGEKISTAITYLTEKSFNSTKNPNNIDKHHNFLVTKKEIDNKIILKLVSGQSLHIEKYIKKMPNDENIAIDKFYNANGIDLRNNIYDEFLKIKYEFISNYNEKHKKEINDINTKLKLEISEFNKVKSNEKRYFSKEKVNCEYIKKSDISITCSKTKIIYTNNPYISYTDIVELIKRVNEFTQKNPLSSDDEDSESEE